MARHLWRPQHGLKERLISWKDDDSPVTEADHRIQQYIIDAVTENYPDHACVAEEDASRTWRGPSSQRLRRSWEHPAEGRIRFPVSRESHEARRP